MYNLGVEIEKKELIYLVVKRVIDITVSILGLIILSPLLLLVAILIKFESKGPIIFTQKRVGFKGNEFNMLKFRSMVVNAEELKDKLKNNNEMS